MSAIFSGFLSLFSSFKIFLVLPSFAALIRLLLALSFLVQNNCQNLFLIEDFGINVNFLPALLSKNAVESIEHISSSQISRYSPSSTSKTL